MPDAREMLKKLAKENRHKRVDIKVPDDITRPAPLKKIKRTGPTRPYQLVDPEGRDKTVHGDSEAMERSGAVAAPEGDLSGGVELRVRKPSVAKVVEAFEEAAVLPVEAVAVQAAASDLKELEIHQTTDYQEANNQLSEYRKADIQKAGSKKAEVREANTDFGREDSPPALLGSAVLAEVGSPSSFPTRQMISHSRGGGQTVTNLAKRSLIQPDWRADLSKDEGFLRAHFRTALGKGKMAKEVDLYCQLYAEARRRQSISLHFLSAELGELVGSSSNGTIRARLLSCEKLELFIQQGFNNETKEHRRGTYIHLRFPWL